MHVEQSKPVVDRLTAWMEYRIEKRLTEPNSSLGGAFKYLLGHLELLGAFLRFGTREGWAASRRGEVTFARRRAIPYPSIHPRRHRRATRTQSLASRETPGE